MGVSGLLPQLKSITKKTHLSSYRGKRVAIDAYCLLHKGAYSCSRELVEGLPTDKCVNYCMGRIDMLIHNGIIPYVVFDGGPLPNKSDEEQSRKRSRDDNLSRARALWAQGNRTAALECYQRAVDITPDVAKSFIDALKRRNIQFIVAPYEADAQMAYLALNGFVDVVLTEDSDLLAYGCPTVFFKMDKTGAGEEINLADLPQCRELNFVGWNHDLFVEMCVMAGCDFANSLPGIGIKKAHAALRRTRCFLRAVRSLKFDGVNVPPEYTIRVQRAIWTFRHQRVFCPERRLVVHLKSPPGGHLTTEATVPEAAQLQDGEADFLGPDLDASIATLIASGELNPLTQQPYGRGGLERGLIRQEEDADEDISNNNDEIEEEQGHLAGITLGRSRSGGSNSQEMSGLLSGGGALLHKCNTGVKKGFKRPRPAGYRADNTLNNEANDDNANNIRPRPLTSARLPSKTVVMQVDASQSSDEKEEAEVREQQQPRRNGMPALKSSLHAALQSHGQWDIQRQHQSGPLNTRIIQPRSTLGASGDQKTAEEELDLPASPTIDDDLGFLNTDKPLNNATKAAAWRLRPPGGAATSVPASPDTDNDELNILPNALDGLGVTPGFYGFNNSEGRPSSKQRIPPTTETGPRTAYAVRAARELSSSPRLDLLADQGGVGGLLEQEFLREEQRRDNRFNKFSLGINRLEEPTRDFDDADNVDLFLERQRHHREPGQSLLPPRDCPDPISDLSHLPACQREAKAVMSVVAGRSVRLAEQTGAIPTNDGDDGRGGRAGNQHNSKPRRKIRIGQDDTGPEINNNLAKAKENQQKERKSGAKFRIADDGAPPAADFGQFAFKK